MNKGKLLIVGAFPSNNKNIYGGILKSCELILDSPIAETFNLIKIDSSQKSNPPPNIFVRYLFALKRIFLLFFNLVLERPKAALIFISDGFGAIEKGFMCLICSFFRCKTMIFPRAGNLMTQTKNSFFMKLLIRFLFKKASIFLCQGEKWKNYAIDFIGFDDSNIRIINNWTATKDHILIGSNRDYDIKPNVKQLLFIGWLEEFKGVFELLEASKELLDEGYEFNLNFAGDGNAMPKAKQYIQNNNLDKFIELSGWIDNKDLLQLLAKSDIFILPSWAEGFPNSMIEAMAAGLSVIVSDVGVVTDFIKNNQNGKIIKPKNKLDIKYAIKSLLDDHNLLKKTAINGHELAKNNFSSELGIQKLSSVIEEIIDKK